MPDPTVVKPGDPGAPGGSTPPNPPAGDPPASSPTPGVKGPDGNPLTFADVLKHPEFQPFLKRQIEDEVTARTSQTVAEVLEQAGLRKPGGNAEDPDAEDVKHIMANFDMEEAKAKELVHWRNRGIDKKTKVLENRFDTLDLSMRFSQVFRENEDAKQLEGKMLEVFNSMTPDEKNFVLKSPKGATFLYGEARQRAGLTPAPARAAGGGSGSSSRSVPASEKTGDSNVQVSQVLDAFKRGDRKEYERLIAGVIRK